MFYGKSSNAQPEFQARKDKSIALGYIYNSSDGATKDYHLLEIEYWHSKYVSGRHYFGITKYAGLEFGLNTENFVVGPKAGISLNYGGIIFGLESIVYSDFKEATWRIAPIFGFGNHRFNLSISPQIKLINRSFSPTNQNQINLVIRIAALKQEDF